ncbi:TonB-dependent receptor plug domain-containing protein [Edaphobacter flagellatus]|uniref:TonB-dependent receptor plug domain-containing protein n=1 Tax=Edaphobacter flagellatus TaxID=1933044 RepID=UPI0021B489B8|nr:TonB-dependent receptor plug domain-containing protein [Edaphobacter flagellatus]
MNQFKFLAMFLASTLAGAQTTMVGTPQLRESGAPSEVAAPASLNSPARITTTTGSKSKFSANTEGGVGQGTDSALSNRAINPFGTLKTNVRVDSQRTDQDSAEGFERRVTSKEIENSAGTFGDPSRYMQMLPGVVSDNDQRNDFLVRGGNPSENLFIIDNIEVPSINQLALSDTTGGFVSMIDNAAIQYMTLHTDAYDSKFDQRLSSIVEISTRPEALVSSHSTLEMGLAGAGGSITRPWGREGSLFISARHSVLQWMTNDIGLNGVPVYKNGLVRADSRIDDKNNWWGLSLTGIDSIKIRPSATDTFETNPFDITYRGWRNVTGVNWQHIFSARSFGVLSLANSQQSQYVLQIDQLQSNATIYDEDTSDGITTVKYDWTSEINKRITWETGVRAAIDRMNYLVKQPIGLQNPYSEDPRPMNATLTDRKFATANSAEYSQATFHLPLEAKVVVGQRLTHWALGGHTEWTPKLLFSAPVAGRLVHVGYAEYVQAPPSLYLLTFNNQQTLKPIRARHVTVGVKVVDATRLGITVEAYQKRYSDYPVASDYPQLSLANIADTFGQAFLMFPMTSRGSGLARGVEGSIESKPVSRLLLTATITYSRNWFSGLDGILRRGNFDLPLVANVGANWRLGRGTSFTMRYSVASGRPYTPDNLPLSFAQNRDVYDLTRINAVRAATYSRLDFRLSHSYVFDRRALTWHAGLVNALGTTNFYSNQWRPRCPTCGVLEQGQMPLLPDAGIQYSF